MATNNGTNRGKTKLRTGLAAMPPCQLGPCKGLPSSGKMRLILWLVLLKLQIFMITIYNTVWTNMIQYVHTSRHASITIIYIYNFIYIYDIWLLYITYILLCLKRPCPPEKRATAETLHEWFVRKMPKRQKLLERQGPPLGASDVYQAGLVDCLSFCFSSLYLIVSDHQCSWYFDGWLDIAYKSGQTYIVYWDWWAFFMGIFNLL